MRTDQQATAAVESPRLPRLTVALGACLGLVVASVLALVYAWLHQAPDQPLAGSSHDIRNMLWCTTTIVVAGALLVAGRLWLGKVQRRTWRMLRVARSWVTPILLAAGGIGAMYLGRTADAFASAAEQQVALHTVAVTTAARLAWWCACLALVALAVIVALGDRPSRLGWPGGLGAAVVVVVAAVAVAVLVPGPVDYQNSVGSPIAPPATPLITGEVAFRVDHGNQGWETAGRFTVAGAGFVRTRGSGTPPGDLVEGFDGATGQRRWSFLLPDAYVRSLASTGTGRDSVVVADYAGFGLIGLDGTTGEVLWMARGLALSEDERAVLDVSAAVVLASPRVTDDGPRVLALSPRTGEVLWTRAFAPGCRDATAAAEAGVLLSGCASLGGIAVLDGVTGEARATLDVGDGSADVLGVQGNRALLSTGTAAMVVDVVSGQVIRTVPEGYDPSFIDDRSLLLIKNGPPDAVQPVAILDLDGGRLIEPELFEVPHTKVVRIGQFWFSSLPTAAVLQEAGTGPWKVDLPVQVIDAVGVVRTMPSSCPRDDEWYVPTLAAVPGALLVNCGTQFIGIR